MVATDKVVDTEKVVEGGDMQRAVKVLTQFVETLDVSKSRGFVFIWKQEGNGRPTKAVMKLGGLSDDQLAYILWNEALSAREQSHKANMAITR